jgi:hypothetical protein
MASVTTDLLTAQLELADQLRAGRDNMRDPQDLPGRYGRVIKAVDHLLEAIDCQAVVASGWAVWRHGYLGRVTQDLDIVVPADRVDELMQLAAVSGFNVLPVRAGTWPKLHHRESDVQVDILPEGARPGIPSNLAPTTIPHPSHLGAREARLSYIHLTGLIELKIAAGRARDESDVVELVRANPDQVDVIRDHLGEVHDRYRTQFDELVARAREETESE